MLKDILIPKKELLQEQIENLEKSGFFTEKEIDRLSAPLKLELAIINLSIENEGYSKSAEHCINDVKDLNAAIFKASGMPKGIMTSNKFHK